jgi:tRNA(Ile)-lysidine synthase
MLINIKKDTKSKPPSLISLVKLIAKQKKLFGPDSKIVVAVSGGPDSVCLLHILYLLSCDWKLGLKVAHFEHGLRGQRSEDDALFVEKLSNDLGLAFYSKHGDV